MPRQKPTGSPKKSPSFWSKVDKFLLLSGYHNYQLTGRYTDSIASQVGFVPFDFEKLEWAKSKDWKWRALTRYFP